MQKHAILKPAAMVWASACVALVVAACGAHSDAISDADSALSAEALFDVSGLRFSGSCTFNPTNGNLVIALASGDSIILSRSSTSAGEITLNGIASYCGDVNYTNVKDTNIFVTGGGTGSNETVVLDFENGYFSPSTGTPTSGIQHDTGSNHDLDLFGIRMPNSTPPVDQNVTIDNAGLHLHGTSAKDVVFQNNNPNTLIILMGSGNDRVNAAGDGTLSGTSLNGITKVYGNRGNDTLYTSGGNFNDLYYGNDGNDTIVVNSNAITGRMLIAPGNSLENVVFAPRTVGVTLTISGNNAGP